MKPLYTQIEFDNAKSNDKLPCKCYTCGDTFFKQKKYILLKINNHQNNDNSYSNTAKFCSKKCNYKSQENKMTLNCTNCDKEFLKHKSEIKKTKNHFCSRSCSASYNNKNKKFGTKRSKLEIWLEKQLTSLYPNLPIDYNQKSVINSELDIYIPSLNVAIELNGIFHYEPIYGVDKLQKIQENDISKSKACHDAKIDLCVIDTSQQKYVKPKTSKKYLDIITNIINERLLIS